ncbi:MAG: type II toxin-antitoxin system PemK/MazF family toxin [Symploca sp. SIO2C1]|nr:type II toxin-antitoxin system PemK/MazF family toxin [Symploca sp. SIO2C1]
MAIKKGDIVLVNFPFTDLSQTKLRPALVLWLSTTGNDATLCAITSQNISSVNPEEFVLDASDAEFTSTGLRVSSKVIVTRIATLNYRLIVRKLGKLGTKHMQVLNTTMIQAFQLT